MTEPQQPDALSRRSFLRSTAAASGLLAVPRAKAAEASPPTRPPQDSYETHAKGIRILPGQWRPHYPWEHIAWVSPSWPSQDYLWLDFPEAIFTRQGLLFLSHVNPAFPVLFPEQPAVPWLPVKGGIAFERRLPNGIAFSGSVIETKDAVELELTLKNGSEAPLNDITLQTCVFLRAIREFSAYTGDNKHVRVPARGWLPFAEAVRLEEAKGSTRLGWRSGPRIADLPVMITTSAEAERLVGFSWGESTCALVCNPHHPCMHSDPEFPDLERGETATIRGKVFFFEGTPDDFSAALDEGVVELPE